MAEVAVGVPGAARGRALGLGEQIARDARARSIAAAAVVLVHAAYPPGHPALAGLGPGAQRAASLLFTFAVTFPVNTFVLLSFLNLAPRLRPGTPALGPVRTLARRLLPAHLFWTAAFLAARAAEAGALPGPGKVAEAVLLGGAAAHLYFTPLLLALTAVAPLLARLAARPRTAVAAGLALAAAAAGLHLAVGAAGPWARAPVGLLGFAPFALAGLALSQAWGGVAPGPDRRGRVLGAAGLALAASGVALAVAAPATRGTFVPAAWAGGNLYALAVPLLLLAWPGTAGSGFLRVARWSLGVYFVHPFFVTALRIAEARVPALAASAPALVLPNAVVAFCASLLAASLLGRTPLRRVVA